MINGQITLWSEPHPPCTLVRRSHGMLEGIIATGHTPPSVTAWLTWLEQRGLAPATTMAEYRRVTTLLNAWLAMRGHDPGAEGDALITATRQELKDWRTSLDRHAPATIQAYAAPVRSYYRWAHEEGLRSDNPVIGMPLPRLGRRLPRPIADQALEAAILDAPPRVRIILVLAAYAGLRAKEIAYLSRDCVVDGAQMAYLLVSGQMAKGSNERIVPLGAYVLSELRIYGLPRRGYIIRRMDGRIGPCSPTLISLIANTYLHEDAGLDETLHQARHRFGTATYNVTRDIRVVQELMGHADPRPTAGYAAFSNATAAAAIEGIEPHRRLRRLDGGAEGQK